MTNIMEKTPQKENKNAIRIWSLKTSTCGLKIINVFFNKGRVQGRLKSAEVQNVRTTHYQKKISQELEKRKTDAESTEVREEMSI